MQITGAPTSTPIPAGIVVSQRFKVYDKTIRDIWEAYQFHRFYLPHLHGLIKKERVPAFPIPSLGGLATKVQNRTDTLGAISHILSQVSPQRSLIVAVSQSEAFLQYLVAQVLRDFPGRLLGSQSDQSARETKLLEIMVNSVDKQEMMEKVIEERVRGLFYGSPRDFFLKDKARLGFEDYFALHYRNAVDRYGEITARRNLLVHNDGRVDRKYLREVPTSPLRLDQKAIVDEQYLRCALLTLRGLCATAGTLVCERIYSDKVHSGKMFLRSRTFKPQK
jgi:hypothetical protein